MRKSNYWFKLEEVDRSDVKTREELIELCNEAGIGLPENPKIFVAIDDDDKIDCYAIEDNNDYIFWMDMFFTPNNRYDVIAEIPE